MIKGKRSSQISTPSKQWKSVRSAEGSLSNDYKRIGTITGTVVSNVQVPAASKVNLPIKQRSRRKMYIPQAFFHKEIKSSEKIVKGKVNKHSISTKVNQTFFDIYVLKTLTVQSSEPTHVFHF